MKQKKKKSGIIVVLVLITLGASLLGNMLAGKGVIWINYEATVTSWEEKTVSRRRGWETTRSV